MIRKNNLRLLVIMVVTVNMVLAGCGASEPCPPLYASDERTDGDPGEISSQIDNYTDKIQSNPLGPELYYKRGLLYEANDDTDSALLDYSQAVLLNPEYYDAFLNRGAIYYEQGDYKFELADMSQAINLRPECAAAFYNRGITYGNKGDL